MGIRTGRIIERSLAALILAGTTGWAEEPPPSPFVPGETLSYEVTWSVFRAGEVRVTLSKVGDGPADDYEVKVTARSQGVASLLYKVDNEFDSMFNPQTLCSSRISKTANEGRRHKKTLIVFDSARKLAVLEERDLTRPNDPPKHIENEIPACGEDVVSGMYFLRSQPLHVGEQIHVPVNDGSKTYDVAAEVQALERIQTRLGGNRMAFRVEPKVFGTLYHRKGRMLVWLSDDEQRLPLRIKVVASVGSITGNLTSVTTQPEKAPSKEP